MKIIKEGKEMPDHRFECTKCGCIFEVTDKEYNKDLIVEKHSSYYITSVYISECKSCNASCEFLNKIK